MSRYTDSYRLPPELDAVASRIFLIRNRLVLLDFDLARLFGIAETDFSKIRIASFREPKRMLIDPRLGQHFRPNQPEDTTLVDILCKDSFSFVPKGVSRELSTDVMSQGRTLSEVLAGIVPRIDMISADELAGFHLDQDEIAAVQELRTNRVQTRREVAAFGEVAVTFYAAVMRSRTALDVSIVMCEFARARTLLTAIRDRESAQRLMEADMYVAKTFRHILKMNKCRRVRSVEDQFIINLADFKPRPTSARKASANASGKPPGIPRDDRLPVQIILVHGTWARGATWTRKGSLLRQALESRFPNAELREFTWTGRNANRARFGAHFDLEAALMVEEMQGHRPRRVLVCHSHAGNIALGVANFRIYGLLSAIVTISSPFLSSWLLPEPYQPSLCRGRDWILITTGVAWLALHPSPFHVFWVLLCVSFTLLFQVYERRIPQSARDERAYSGFASGKKNSVPLLAVTARNDEAYLLLRCVAVVHFYLNILRAVPSRLSLVWSVSSWGWKLKTAVLVCFPLRPLLNLFALFSAILQKCLFGQPIEPGLYLQMAVSQDPPSQFTDKRVQFFRPVNSLLRHSGVYRSEEAVQFVASWIFQVLVPDKRTQ